MTLTVGGIAAACLLIGLALLKKKLAKSAATRLLLLAGFFGIGGVLGDLTARIIRSGLDGTSNLTERLLGTGAGGLLGLAVLSIFVWPHVRPKAAPPTKATPVLAFIWGGVAAAVGGLFTAAAGLSSNFAVEAVNGINQAATMFLQGFS